MTSDRDPALVAGVTAALEVLVDALTARDPGLAIAIEERLQRRVAALYATGAETNYRAAGVLIAVLEVAVANATSKQGP